jgi:hypothetical protein
VEGRPCNVLDVVDHLGRVSIIDLDMTNKVKVVSTLDNLYKLNKIVNKDIGEVFAMWNPL